MKIKDIIHGVVCKHSPEEAFDIPAYAAKLLYPVVDEYIEWYADHGISLPEAYALDPSGWTEVLRKIQRAFYLKSTENDHGSEIMEAKRTLHDDRLESLREEMQSGFYLFGKHFLELFDKYGVPADYGNEKTH